MAARPAVDDVLDDDDELELEEDVEVEEVVEEKRPPRRKPDNLPRGGGPGPRPGGGRTMGGPGGGPGMGGKRGGYFQGRRKVCPIKLEEISWKNLDALRYFVSENGSIRPRRKTGANAKIQRRAAAAIKRARHMALLPYTSEHVRVMGRR